MLNNMRTQLLKFFKVLISFSILLFCSCLPHKAAAQINSAQIEDARIVALIQKVQAKSKRNRAAYLSEYNRTYKLTIEREDTNKINSWGFEQYCLNDGKTYCRTIEIEKDGKPRSPSKIQKEREKVSKNLAKNEDYVGKDDPFGYGTGINSLWIDPSLYLKNCRIVLVDEKQIAGRASILLRVNDCKLDNAYSKWMRMSSLQFMTKTEAEIVIDEKDESVMRMDVYAKKEFYSVSDRTRPIISMENTRMPEGFWLFKKIRLETIGNKLVFPDLKDNWQYEFFDYKHLDVDIQFDIDMVKKPS